MRKGVDVMRRSLAVAAALLAVLAAGALAGDRVYVQGGASVEGRITSETDQAVTIALDGGGEMTLSRANITKIVRNGKVETLVPETSKTLAPDAPKLPKVEPWSAAQEEALEKALDAFFAAKADAERDQAFAALKPAGETRSREALEAIRSAAEKAPRGKPEKAVCPWIKGTDRNWYFLAVPKGYTPERSWPLALALHGTDNSPVNISTHHADDQRRYGMIMAFPMTTSTRHFWSTPPEPENLLRIAAHVAASYRVDPRRVFCSGGSGGGMGTWSLLAIYPDVFAAGASTSGMPGASGEALKRIVDIPFYVLHGRNDHIKIEWVEKGIAELRGYGGKPTYVVHDGNHFPAEPLWQAMYKWLGEQPAKPSSPRRILESFAARLDKPIEVAPEFNFKPASK